jgi:hypothetical protein
LALENLDKRNLKDRRKQPTPGLSRYSLLGQRGVFRRKVEQQRGGYVDRYNPGLFFILLLIVGLNVLDALCTMMILDQGGWEVNPIIRSIIELYGDWFWVWKFAIVSTSLFLLCIHSKFRRVKTIIVAAGSVYAGILLYQIFLIVHRLSTNP